MEMEALKPLIEMVADKYDLRPEIVYGVVKKESAFEPAAARFEKHYRYLYKPEQVKPAGCSLDTEITLQKTSLGLMQVMGGVYRELGYRGWLSEIFEDVELQLDYGCRFLAAKIRQYGELRGLSAYNAGSPTDSNVNTYVNPVLAYAKEWASL